MCHEAGQGVGLVGGEDEVPLQARGVVEQVQHGDPLRGALVGELQLGNVPAYRGVQLHPALRDQAHQRGGGEGLGHRRQVEERVVVDRLRVVEVGHPVGGAGLLTVHQHSDADPGNAELLGGRLDERGQLVPSHAVAFVAHLRSLPGGVCLVLPDRRTMRPPTDDRLTAR